MYEATVKQIITVIRKAKTMFIKFSPKTFVSFGCFCKDVNNSLMYYNIL